MANLKQESINQFEGFGNDNKISQGEYYRSSGFLRSQNGVTTGGVLVNLMNGNALTDLGSMTSTSLAYARSFAFATQTPDNYLFNSGTSGEILQSYQGLLSGSSAEYAHRSLQNHAYFHHLITDPKGRLLYHQDRYLGMFDGTGSTTNYITGTISVTNGSGAVVGTGTTFTAGMVGKVLRISGENKFYTISAYTDATHITINTYTGTTGSGKSYVINTQWNDTWKDFGAVVTLPNGSTPKCPMDVYEDTVIFGRGNVVTTLNVLTDTITTDALPALSLPAGYSIEHIVSNSNGIIIAGNVRSKGFVLLWDNLSDRAIAPWIWFDDSILSVCRDGSNWIVVTAHGIHRTNGYSSELITTEILESSTSKMMTASPKSTLVIDNDLYFYGSGTDRAVKRNVLYRINLTSKLVEAMPRYTLNQGSTTCAQLEFVAEANRLFLAMNDVSGEGGTDYLSLSSAPACSTFITNPVGKGDNKKTARFIKIRLRRNSKGSSNVSNTIAFTLVVKIADTKHTMHGLTIAKITSLAKNQITVNATISSLMRAIKGYEVEVTGDSGLNTNAGYARNIQSISGEGTATEVWTLDSDFPSFMEINQRLVLTPFQLVARKSVSVSGGEFEEFIFPVKNSITARKFMIKVDIEANTSGVPIEMEEPVIIYEDKGSI